jgi:SAM-dependent methyltransferase
MKPWYERDSFWHTWAPFMFSQERWKDAADEVDSLVKLTQIEPGDSVLDLCCGPGRHALEFAKRGFSVTGVDRTKEYLKEAVKGAKKQKLNVKFVQQDMRKFCRPGKFDAALNLFTSFGFFENKKDDQMVARNVYRSLKDGGVFVVDLMGKEVLARIFRERDWREFKGGIILEERKVSQDWSWMENRWMLLKDGRIREFRFSHRPYSAAELSGLLADCGFAKTEVYGSLYGIPYDHQARRLVVVAHKRKQKRK